MRTIGRRRAWLLLAVALLAALAAIEFRPLASACYVEWAGHRLDASVPGAADYQAARQALLRALDWNVANAQAYRLLAQVYERQGNGQACAEAWAGFVGQRPGDPQGYWELAGACERLASAELPLVAGQPCGKDEASRRQALSSLWQKAGQTAPGFVRAGGSARSASEWDQALGFYHRALLLDPRSVDAWVGMAEVYRSIGESELALHALAQVAALSSDPPVRAAAYNSRGQILAQAQRWAEACAQLAQAVRLAPQAGEYHLSYGWYLLLAGGANSQARAELAAAAGLMPANPWPHVHLANLSFAEKDYSAALAEAEQVLRLEPGLFWGWIWRGKALAQLGRLAEAEEALRRSVEAAPEKASPHAELGVLLKRLGQTDAAVAEYEQAIRLAPDDEWYNLGLADAYRAAGQVDEALRQYRRVLELNPENVPARKAVEELAR